MSKFDVAIVGAGPAGAWAAYRLARQGARVVIFDPSHPREKPCGGGVTGRALALASGAIDLGRFTARTITSARFTVAARHESISMALPPDERGVALLVANRSDFDRALLHAAQEAGALHVAARVTDVSAAADGVTLRTAAGRHRVDFVIGADGANSLVRRRLSIPFRRDDLSIATGYFAHGVTSAEIVIELMTDPPGYLWSFPRPSHLAIGVCAQAHADVTVAALRQRVGDWITTTAIADGARLEPYSWPIPSLGPDRLERLELAGGRWGLVGDAAGLVDPITREGIYFAMASGQWMAESLGATGMADTYAERVRDEILTELVLAARLKAGFFRPAFSNLLMPALRDSAAVRAVMADLIAGRQAYAGLKGRLLRTFEFGLTWRALRAVRQRW